MSTPMTYLQLVQRLRREVGASGTGPATVIGQAGEYQRLADNIADADEEVQQEHDSWKFMSGTFSLTTAATVAKYGLAAFTPPITDLRGWKATGAKCYLQSVGRVSEWPLYWMDPDEFDAIYGTGVQGPGVPRYFSTNDAGDMLIGPTPNAAYVITGKYARAASRLAVDADVPKYPAEFHMLAVYLGMMKYGRYTGATEVYQDGERLYNKMLLRMRRTQLPDFAPLIPLA